MAPKFFFLLLMIGVGRFYAQEMTEIHYYSNLFHGPNMVCQSCDGNILVQCDVNLNGEKIGSKLLKFNKQGNCLDSLFMDDDALVKTFICANPLGDVDEEMGVPETEVEESMAAAYPNPGGAILNIRTSLPNALVEVYDASGRIVCRRAMEDNVIEIDASDWPVDWYVWKVNWNGVEAGRGVWVNSCK